MSALSIGALRETAVAAAKAVGPQLVDAFRSPMQAHCKQDSRDRVTEHDWAAELDIREIIVDRWPDSSIVGEELGGSADAEVVWYVDPIDGTGAFIQGLAFFSTSIAAVVNGQQLVGVVYDPVAGELFVADDEGAYLNDVRLPELTAGDEDSSDLLSGFPNARDLAHNRNEYLGLFGDLVETHLSVRRIASAALSLAYVAAGRADAVLGANVKPWDIAAGSLLVRRTGGQYLGLGPEGLDPKHFDSRIYFAHRPGDHPLLRATAQSIDSIRQQPAAIQGGPTLR